MQINNIPTDQFMLWKKRRRNTLIGYLLTGIVVGIDYSYISTTLYSYLEKVVKIERPMLFYGITLCLYNISSTVCGIFVGRWVDKTRKYRLFIQLSLFLQLAGCLLYVVHFHIFYPLLGRILGGIGDAFPSIITGELMRTYDDEGSTQALCWLSTTYSVGALIGPAIVIFVEDIHFSIGLLEICKLNAVALVMAVLLFVTLIWTDLLLYDCSAEIDLKECLKQESMKPSGDVEDHTIVSEKHCLMDDKEAGDNISEKVAEQPTKDILEKLVKNKDAILLYITTFVFTYSMYCGDTVLPLITIKILGWSLNTLNYIYIGYGVVHFSFFLLLSRLGTSNKTNYIVTLVCMLAAIMMIVTLMVIKTMPRNIITDWFLLLCFLMMNIFSWVLEAVQMRYMFAKLVPSHCQSFAEGTRNAVSKFSLIVGAVTVPLALPFLELWGSALIPFMAIIFIIFIARRKYLSYIKEIQM